MAWTRQQGGNYEKAETPELVEQVSPADDQLRGMPWTQYAWEVTEAGAEVEMQAATAPVMEAVTKDGTVDVLDEHDATVDVLPGALECVMLTTLHVALGGRGRGHAGRRAAAYVAALARHQNESPRGKNFHALDERRTSVACDHSWQVVLAPTWALPTALRDCA